MHLSGVRRQVEEAKQSLTESAGLAAQKLYDPAYRAALRSRNLLFHATRGLAAAHGQPLPEMPVIGRFDAGAGIADHQSALEALDRALAVSDDLAMQPELERAREPYARYLGWLREEVGRIMRQTD